MCWGMAWQCVGAVGGARSGRGVAGVGAEWEVGRAGGRAVGVKAPRTRGGVEHAGVRACVLGPGACVWLGVGVDVASIVACEKE